jgi:hypothetical protein
MRSLVARFSTALTLTALSLMGACGDGQSTAVDADPPSTATAPTHVVEPLDRRNEPTFGVVSETLALAQTNELAARPEGVGAAHEDRYWSLDGPTDFYFVDPGETGFTIMDTASGALGTHGFVDGPSAP